MPARVCSCWLNDTQKPVRTPMKERPINEINTYSHFIDKKNNSSSTSPEAATLICGSPFLIGERTHDYPKSFGLYSNAKNFNSDYPLCYDCEEMVKSREPEELREFVPAG